jgi:hypothetical protein
VAEFAAVLRVRLLHLQLGGVINNGSCNAANSNGNIVRCV